MQVDYNKAFTHTLANASTSARVCEYFVDGAIPILGKRNQGQRLVVFLVRLGSARRQH